MLFYFVLSLPHSLEIDYHSYNYQDKIHEKWLFIDFKIEPQENKQNEHCTDGGYVAKKQTCCFEFSIYDV